MFLRFAGCIALCKMSNKHLQLSFVIPIFFILLGFYLRLSGVSFGLPYLYHADEPIVVNHALAYGSGDLNPHFFKIPPLVSYILFIFYGFLFLTGQALQFWQNPSDFEIFFYRDPSLFYFTGRILLGVIPGTLSLVLLWNLIRKHFNLIMANIALMLFSLNFLHVRDSHYIYADIPLIFVIIGTFGILWKQIDSPESGRLNILSGMMIGLATALKYNGIFLVIPYLFCLFPNFRFKKALYAGFCCILTFLVLNPFCILAFPEFWHEIRTQSKAHGFTGFFHHFNYSLREGVGLTAVVLSFVSLFLIKSSFLSKNGRKKIVMIATFVFFYYGVIVLKGQHYDRYILPLLPGIVILSSAVLTWIWIKNKWGKPVTLILLLMILVPNTIKSFTVTQLMKQEDVRTSAKNWIESNIPPGSKIALGWDFYMPRLSFSESQLDEKFREISQHTGYGQAQKKRLKVLKTLSSQKSSYQIFFLSDQFNEFSRPLLAKPVIKRDFSALHKAGIEWILIEIKSPESLNSAFYQELVQKTTLVKVFTPYKTEKEFWPYDSQPLTGAPFLTKELVRRNQNGLTLTLFRLESRVPDDKDDK